MLHGTVRSSQPFILDVVHTHANDPSFREELQVHVEWPLSRPDPGTSAVVRGICTFKRDNVLVVKAFFVDEVKLKCPTKP